MYRDNSLIPAEAVRLATAATEPRLRLAALPIIGRLDPARAVDALGNQNTVTWTNSKDPSQLSGKGLVHISVAFICSFSSIRKR